jgi:hypothetical protein
MNQHHLIEDKEIDEHGFYAMGYFVKVQATKRKSKLFVDVNEKVF